ncbi:serine hydrolase domain-containing protein [Muricoccus vinaceus]|uniref:Serine hydrolase domain-containing protein n=1 Tax=Muricoccus vinaceus TaxID=424704 RepID=A0ABV6IV93_9PROT
MIARRAALTLPAGLALMATHTSPSAAQGAAPPLERAERPEELGFSRERLGRLTAWYQAEVDAGRIPGAVVVVGRAGRLAWHEAIGMRDRDTRAPMQKDTLFRIASMTKPVTSLAAMILVEEARLMLWHPVSRFLPEFKDLKVGTEGAALEREPTVLDLLRHTSGLTYGSPTAPAGSIARAYADAKVGDQSQTGEAFTANIARQPLAHQPGRYWDYSHSTDVLGRVVEVASGQPLDRFFAERILGPLGMTETAFRAGQERAGRLAQPQIDPLTNARQYIPALVERPNWFWGGQGLVSNAIDYARLCQMFLGNGSLGDTRVVSRSTVALMAADHLPPGTGTEPEVFRNQAVLAPVPENGHGFGLGFVVRSSAGRTPLPGSAGDYSWAGAYGPYFWIDPKEDLYAVLMIQGPANRMHYRYAMRQLVYQALT